MSVYFNWSLCFLLLDMFHKIEQVLFYGILFIVLLIRTSSIKWNMSDEIINYMLVKTIFQKNEPIKINYLNEISIIT